MQLLFIVLSNGILFVYVDYSFIADFFDPCHSSILCNGLCKNKSISLTVLSNISKSCIDGITNVFKVLFHAVNCYGTAYFSTV